MIIIIVLVLVLIIGIVWFNIDDLSFGAIGFLFGGIAGLVLCIVFLVVMPLEIKKEISQFNAIKHTLEIARENETIENTAIQLKIIKANEWLAGVQYYNSTMFKLWIPDIVNELEPLK